jgi:hypothetical protein
VVPSGAGGAEVDEAVSGAELATLCYRRQIGFAGEILSAEGIVAVFAEETAVDSFQSLSVC